MSLVRNPEDIRLAVLGMSEGNGHPYSWSAIFNGFDPRGMADSGYPNILRYLSAEPKASFGFPGARVTHVWCPRRDDSEKVSKASLVPHIAESPEDLIGEVDAAIIATDVGREHLRQAGPFLDAGVPLFIDKPLTDDLDDLREFARLARQGKPFLSSSCMRYAREFENPTQLLDAVGDLRLVTMTMCKDWERYGIHALEAVYGFLPPGGWTSARNTGTESRNIVHLTHRCGVDVVVGNIADLLGAFGCLGLFGTRGCVNLRFKDTFHAFKKQLEDFVRYLRTGERPFVFEETAELIRLLVAGLESRRQGGRPILLSEFEG